MTGINCIREQQEVGSTPGSVWVSSPGSRSGRGVGDVCLTLYERTARKPLQMPLSEHGESSGDECWKVWKEIKYNSI